MDFSDPEPPAPALVRADPVERFFAPQALSHVAERTRLALFFAVFLACHIALLALVLVYGFEDPPPAEQEIAVELVPPPEQQKPTPPPQQPPPSEQQPQKEAQKPPPEIDMTPAEDAPRAENKETVDRKAPDRETASQRVDTPAEQGTKGDSPDKPADARSTPAPAQGPVATRSAIERPDAETTDYAEPKPDATAERSASPERKPQAGADLPTIAQMMARLQPVPDYKISGAAPPLPVSGGTAKPNYLSMLHGLIMRRMREPSSLPSGAQGSIVIYIDTSGHILHAGVLQPSGSVGFDNAALSAVKDAAPFPPPPANMPPVRFTYCRKERC